MANNPRDYRAQLRARLDRAKQIMDSASGRDLTYHERGQLADIVAEGRAIRARLDQSKRDYEQRAELDRMFSGEPSDVVLAESHYQPKGRNLTLTDDPYYQAPGKESLGARFTNAPEFKAWHRQVAGSSGIISDNAAGLQSPAVRFPGGLKTLLTGASDTSAGAMVFPQVQSPVPLLRRPLTFAELCTHVPVTTDSVTFAKQDTETNAAAAVAEATATAGTSGTKPESGMTFAVVNVGIKTIATWLPVTKRAMSDAPGLQALIDEFLLHAVNEELEDGLIAGDGTGENLTGLNNVSGIQTQAWDTNNLVTTMRAREKVTTVGRAKPTAYLLHPTDWTNILLSRDTQGRFMAMDPVGPFSYPTLWGLPVALCEALAQGVGYVGAFNEVIIFDREAFSVSISSAHSDFFTRNLLAVLGELRVGMVVRRPSAIVKMTALSVGGS